MVRSWIGERFDREPPRKAERPAIPERLLRQARGGVGGQSIQEHSDELGLVATPNLSLKRTNII